MALYGLMGWKSACKFLEPVLVISCSSVISTTPTSYLRLLSFLYFILWNIDKFTLFDCDYNL